jgi:hypothetical protein
MKLSEKDWRLIHDALNAAIVHATERGDDAAKSHKPILSAQWRARAQDLLDVKGRIP